MAEEWRDIAGYEGLYQVSNLGNVKSLIRWKGTHYLPTEKILKKSKTTTGYWKVELTKDKIRKSLKVHRLVAIAFIENPEGKPHINHKDGNPLNNEVGNLEWCTQKENAEHAIRTGLKKSFKIDPEYLEEMYVGKRMTADRIAEAVGTNRGTIYNLLKKNGIARRNRFEYKSKYNIPLDELIKDFNGGMSNKEIRKKYNCSTELVATRRYQLKKKGKVM